MKSSGSCRVCRRWLEGEWSQATPEQREVIEKEMAQGHCETCPPTLNFLDCTAVGIILGRCAGRKPLAARTVSTYMTQSTTPGGRYVDHPFPAPNNYIGRHPYWLPDRVPEIEHWARTRVGQGTRPKRKKRGHHAEQDRLPSGRTGRGAQVAGPEPISGGSEGGA